MRIVVQVILAGLFVTSTALSAPLINSASAPIKKPFLPNQVDINLPEVILREDQDITATIELVVPAQHHLNLQAPSRVVITSPDTTLGLSSAITSLSQALAIPVLTKPKGVLEFSAVVYYCSDGNEALCLIRGLAIQQPYKTAAGAATTLNIKAEIPRN